MNLNVVRCVEIEKKKMVEQVSEKKEVNWMGDVGLGRKNRLISLNALFKLTRSGCWKLEKNR